VHAAGAVISGYLLGCRGSHGDAHCMQWDLWDVMLAGANLAGVLLLTWQEEVEPAQHRRAQWAPGQLTQPHSPRLATSVRTRSKVSAMPLPFQLQHPASISSTGMMRFKRHSPLACKISHTCMPCAVSCSQWRCNQRSPQQPSCSARSSRRLIRPRPARRARAGTLRRPSGPSTSAQTCAHRCRLGSHAPASPLQTALRCHFAV
jgi:hypothetical protein